MGGDDPEGFPFPFNKPPLEVDAIIFALGLPPPVLADDFVESLRQEAEKEDRVISHMVRVLVKEYGYPTCQNRGDNDQATFPRRTR